MLKRNRLEPDPHSGRMSYKLVVKCKCYCHEKDFEFQFTTVPCCQCNQYGLGKPAEDIEVYLPLMCEGDSVMISKRNRHTLSKHPEITEMLSIPIINKLISKKQ